MTNFIVRLTSPSDVLMACVACINIYDMYEDLLTKQLLISVSVENETNCWESDAELWPMAASVCILRLSHLSDCGIALVSYDSTAFWFYFTTGRATFLAIRRVPMAWQDLIGSSMNGIHNASYCPEVVPWQDSADCLAVVKVESTEITGHENCRQSRIRTQRWDHHGQSLMITELLLRNNVLYFNKKSNTNFLKYY